MSLIQDTRFAVRMMAKNKLYTAAAVSALAVGIGANATVFTLVNAVLFKGLPFKEADRIMHVGSSDPARGRMRLRTSYADFRDLQANLKSFSDLAAFTGMQANVSDGVNAPERYGCEPVTSNAFRITGQKPILGRDFTSEDEKLGAPAVAIIGYAMWHSRYGGDAGVIGRTIRVNDVPTTIVGVMPQGFRFPIGAAMWTAYRPPNGGANRDSRDLGVFGMLAPGVSLKQARAELAMVSRQLEHAHPATNKGIAFRLQPYNDEFNGGQIRIAFLALLGAVGLVLLIACANVANLLLARSMARGREMSIRAALGASRSRVIRQLLVESLLLGLIGGAFGLLIALFGVQAFDASVADVGKPYWIQFTIDYRVVAYFAAICVGASLLFGLAPALHASRADVNDTLKEGGRGVSGSRRTQLFSSSLVAGQLALAFVLLIGAGLMIRSFFELNGMRPMAHADRIMTMRVSLPEAKYRTPEQRLRFFETLEPKIAAATGVQMAALASHLPNQGAFEWKFEVDGRAPVEPERRPTTMVLVIAPRYFEVLGLPIIRGREFTAADGTPGKEGVVVNRAFAEKHWPGSDPVARRVRLHRRNQDQWFTVVGVSPNLRQNSPTDPEIRPVVYLPYRAEHVDSMVILARAGSAAEQLATPLRFALQSVDPNLAAYGVQTLQRSFENERWFLRVFGTLFSVFAGFALLLAAIGIYGIMAYAVTRRTQEIGIRMALGADAGAIRGMLLSHGLKRLAMGLALGAAAAFGAAQVMRQTLVGVTPTDPLTFVIIAVILATAGTLACWLPARRAMRVDPVIALRYE